MSCFVCENNEGEIYSYKEFFNCECDIHAHYNCFRMYRYRTNYCPVCKCDQRCINMQTPLITRKTESLSCVTFFISISLLIDLSVFMMYLVGITSNMNIEKDLQIAIPALFLLIIDIIVLSNNIAGIVSRNINLNFKRSLVISSLIYFSSFVISILVFTNKSDYSSFIIQATYAFIVVQCLFTPRIMLYTRHTF